jgi:hypothetical protein
MEDFFLNTVGVFIVQHAQSNPGIVSLLSLLGLIRLLVKPLMTLLHTYVDYTPSDTDNKWLAALEESKGYKVFLYLVDWLLSVKVPTKK